MSQPHSAQPHRPGGSYAPAGFSAPRPSRRRWPWVLLIVVVVLLGLAVAADRIALHLVEDKAATTLQDSQDLSMTPDVSIGGFPFLTQLASRKFDDVTISDDDVRLDSGLHLQTLKVDLTDVSVSSDYNSVHAVQAVADGLLGNDELSDVLGFEIHGTDNGTLVARRSATILGHTYTARLSMRVSTSGSEVKFTDIRLLNLDVPDEVASALTTGFDTAVSLAGLPFHIRLTGADVTTDGIALQLTGSDLTYTR